MIENIFFNCSDEVVELPNGRVFFRSVLESFYPGEYLTAMAVDVWSYMLNFYEKDRDINKSPLRLYMTVDMTIRYSYLIITLKINI
jgi:hypothetical protein